MNKLLLIIAFIMSLITIAVGICYFIDTIDLGLYKYLPILTGFIAIVSILFVIMNRK